MPTLGEEWYQKFWEHFHKYVSHHSREVWEKDVSDKVWSKFMFELLKQIAKEIDFDKVEPEETTIKGQRFDMVWRSSKDAKKTIALEHENKWVEYAIKEEFPKLAQVKASLHILITYVKDQEFPGYKYAELIRKTLESSGYDDEFLLILGSGSMLSPGDWVCHRIYPEVKLGSELLAFPSPIWLIPYLETSSKKAEAGVPEWMINRLRIWKRIYAKGGLVTKDELHNIAKECGLDRRGLGGFFRGKNKSLFWSKDGKVSLSPKATANVKALGDKVD